MKKRVILLPIFSAVIFSMFVSQVCAGPEADKNDLKAPIDLSGKRTVATQYYQMESSLISYGLDGAITGRTVFRLHLKAVPAQVAGKDRDEYTCLRFTVQEGDSSAVEIPALKNWSYNFYGPDIDEKGQVFGIDHSKFENVVDSKGNVLTPDKAYHVYNAFIDFHAFCDVFGQPTSEGAGIQNLTSIGQKIVHSAAHSEAPVNLGSGIKEGSTFINGEITLELKGMSLVDDKRCALVEYDSGESSFKMTLEPMPNFEVNTIGSSHYFGDLYKNLLTNWIQKATMKEFVVSETTLPVSPNKINAVIERNIVILNVDQKEMSALIQ